MDPTQYDLVVIGSGPAGQKAAICAAKLRKTVAIIERKRSIGGVCKHRHHPQQDLPRSGPLFEWSPATHFLRPQLRRERPDFHEVRSDAVMAREIEVIKAQLRRNRVAVLEGSAVSSIPTPLRLCAKMDRWWCAGPTS